MRLTTRGIPREAEELLRSIEVERPKEKRLSRFVGGVIGGVLGAMVGFVGLLLIFGPLGDGQGGLAALLLGVPIGGWIGAEIGADEGGR